jgi:uncharacterized protein DUF6049
MVARPAYRAWSASDRLYDCWVRSRVRTAVRALLTLIALVAAGVATAIAPTPAYAEEPVALVRITLKSITPALPAPSGQVTLAGTATNITSERIFRAQAYFWRNQAPITNREGFDQALESASNEPLGSRVVDGYQNLYDDADPYLNPGETDAFTLTANVADLELSPTDGVYLMGVHVLQNNNPVAIGRARVFVPVVTDPPPGQLRMTSLVTFTSQPALVRTGVLANDHLAREVAPNGRLSKLLTAADADNLSYAVDPALLDDLQTMAGGYSVLDGDGGTVPGTGATDAARWLGGFSALQSRREGYRLLYGSPDLAALIHDGQLSAIRATAAASRRAALTRGLPLLVLPTGGRADEATVVAAGDLNPKAIVLSDRSAAGPGPLLTGPSTAPIISVSSAVSGGGPGPDPRDTAVQLQQRLLAETWIEASNDSDGSARGRVRLITSANQATRAYAEVDAPWLTPGPLSTLLQSRPAVWSEEYSYPNAVRDGELTKSQLSSLRRFNATQRTYTDMLVDGKQAEAAGGAAVARAASGAWRRQDRARQAFLDPQQAAVEALVVDGVQIPQPPRVSTAGQEGVVFPITVRNLIPPGADPDDNAVRVRVVFTSDTEQRLTIKPIELPLVRPGENVTRDAEVTARANGVVPVTAQLQTESGRPVGKPVQLQVRVTQNGTTGWLIALAAGLVLIGSTALRIRTVGKERAREAAAATVEPPSALTSAPPADAPPGVAELTGARTAAIAPLDVNDPPPIPVPPADRGDG